MHRSLSGLFALSIAPLFAPQARAEAPAALTTGIVQGRVNLTSDQVMGGPTLTYGQTMDAITGQISVLSRLRDWRGTFSGSGPRAQRLWTLGAPRGQKVQLAVGAQVLPQFQLAGLPASAVGTSLRIGRFAAGTTWRPQELDDATAKYDSLMTGTPLPATPVAPAPAPWAWFSLRPVQTKSGNIDVLHARRSEDGHDSLFSGARGEWQAPLNWKVNGEWSQSERDDAAARAWSLGATGPVRHPWGKATATALVKEVRPGYIGWDGTAAAAAQDGSLALQQNIAVGEVSGSLAFTVAQNRPLSETIAPDIALTQQAQSNADLRWKLTPAISVITRHSLKSTAQRVETAPGSTPDPNAAPDPSGDSAAAGVPAPAGAPGTTFVADRARPDAWQIANEQSADAGLEWKWSRSLAFSATAGQTWTARRLAGDPFAPTADFAPGAEACNRLELGLQRRTAGGAWSIGLSRQLQASSPSVFLAPVPASQLDGLQLAGERNLGPGLKIKGTYGVTNNYSLAEQLLNARVARSIEAQWSLDMGRIDLSMSDADGTAGLATDAARAYAARFNLGSADKGNGLGLAFEYARSQTPGTDATPTWRVGITYK